MTEEDNNSTFKEKCFQFQLELLKDEIRSIDQIIGRMDTITQTTKNWAIVTWTASIGVFLGKPELRPFLAVTAVLPLAFWFIDATWRRLQMRSVYRARKISDFVNDGRLLRSYETYLLEGFSILDPIGVTHRHEEEYRAYVSLSRTLFFREVWVIYWVLFGISILLGILVNLI